MCLSVFVIYCLLFVGQQLRSIDATVDVSPTPIVFYHGMGDTSHGSIYSLQKWLESKIAGVYVMSIRMGNNTAEDLMSGYFMNLNDQVTEACRQLTADTRLANGFNAIGFSQGGQIIRAIAQRCPTIKILNLISLGGQHQGVYGLPRCPQANHICDLVRKLLNYGAYEEYIQNHVVQAEYWHDPLQEDLYKQKNIFLADINNENIPRNTTYKERILKLKNFVLVKFLNDSMVEPRESSLFGFYIAGQAQDIYKMKDTTLYTEDWIGLKELDISGRLHLYEVIGDHLQIDIKWFEEEIVNKYLK
ncbi:palmitoyl-protein thioesterase 1-like [Oppia nitens]|uniref:palmitoyl-protein thioesterase 1-like n=1 Tax=Oppia nitens TaxID=1686743 RepID=UPI0023DCE64A|nr:palmitoyl-protein thioesterase 1-like [Oppia nitens]